MNVTGLLGIVPTPTYPLKPDQIFSGRVHQHTSPTHLATYQEMTERMLQAPEHALALMN